MKQTFNNNPSNNLQTRHQADSSPSKANEKTNRAAVFSIGSELTQGETLNTGIHFLSRALNAEGISVSFQITVPDHSDTFLHYMKAALDTDISLLIITGGLGPTADDLTREFLADLAGVSLQYVPEADDSIQSFSQAHAISYFEKSKQAYFPEGATWLLNENGTAPGIRMRIRSTEIFAIPGVPGETRSMFAAHIQPFLKQLNRQPFFKKEFRFIHLPETKLQKILNGLSFPKSVAWSSLPENDGILFRLYGHSEKDVEMSASAFQKAICPECIVSDSGESLIQILLRLLQERNETLCTAESCTGGLIASEIVAVPGSSAVFDGGIVSYVNRVKQTLLNVHSENLENFGAVSSEVVAEMAIGARERLGSTWAVATSGIAGPGGGSPEKPVGLVWFAISNSKKTETFCKNFTGSRQEIRFKSVYYILGRLFEKIKSFA